MGQTNLMPNACYDYLRPQKAIAIKKAHESFPMIEDVDYREVDNACILPLKRFSEDTLQFGRAGVMDAEGNYVSASAVPKRVEGVYPIEKTEHKEETVVYCGYLVRQWGHFLIEAVSRLWYFIEHDSENIDKYVFVTENGGKTEIKGNYKEFLELLGIYDRIEIVNTPTQYTRVIVPEASYVYNRYWTAQYKSIFDRVIKNAMRYPIKTDQIEKVFLSRSQFPKARQAEAGLELLDHFFDINGFKVIYPEKISLVEMIYLLQNAKVCAAESGTTPHNFLFGRDHQRTIIIERMSVPNNTQMNLDCVKNQVVTYIDAHYTIYPVFAGYGPCFLAFNSVLKKYSNDNKMKYPNEFFWNEKIVKRYLCHYLQEYKNTNYLALGIEDWMVSNYSDVIYEGYIDTMKEIGQYLRGEEMFCWKQLFELRFIKLCIKKLLKK